MLNDQGLNVEATVLQMLNQGNIRKKGCNLFRAPFLVTFLEKQKSDQKKLSEPRFMGFKDYWDLALTVIKSFKIRSQKILKEKFTLSKYRSRNFC